MNTMINSIVNVMARTEVDSIEEFRMNVICKDKFGEEAGAYIAEYIVRVEAKRTTISYALFTELVQALDRFKINRVSNMAKQLPKTNFMAAFGACALYLLIDEGGWEPHPMTDEDLDYQMTKLTLLVKVAMSAYIDGLLSNDIEPNIYRLSESITNWMANMDEVLVDELFFITEEYQREKLLVEVDVCAEELVKIVNEYGINIFC